METPTRRGSGSKDRSSSIGTIRATAFPYRRMVIGIREAATCQITPEKRALASFTFIVVGINSSSLSIAVSLTYSDQPSQLLRMSTGSGGRTDWESRHLGGVSRRIGGARRPAEPRTAVERRPYRIFAFARGVAAARSAWAALLRRSLIAPHLRAVLRSNRGGSRSCRRGGRARSCRGARNGSSARG